MADLQKNKLKAPSSAPGESSAQVQLDPSSMINREVANTEVVQGRVFYLPAKEDLPKGSVLRVRGLGAAEDAVYGRPVLVVSRPQDDNEIAHFMMITTLQGRPLEQVYGKPNDYDTKQRLRYLPIAPAPEHPDARLSKRMKKKFPTLTFADAITLRQDSYVEIRSIYIVKWSLLKPLGHARSPDMVAKLHPDSVLQVLSRTRTFTDYEAGPQYNVPGQVKTVSRRQKRERRRNNWLAEQDRKHNRARKQTTLPESDFRRAEFSVARIVGPVPKVPPDIIRSPVVIVEDVVLQDGGRSQGGNKIMTVDEVWKTMSGPFDASAIRKPLNRFWVDAKGVTAIAIASI